MAFVVGLTGGIGSGKSAAAAEFARLGATVVDADAIAHELTGPGGAAIPAIRELFAQREDRTIFLEADRGLPYATVVDLMDTCRTAGVQRIGVLTRKSVDEN